MNDINRVYLIGRLTADPELKTISGGSQVCSFSIANNRSYTRQNGETVDEVSYFNCTIWGKPGEILHRYTGKGRQIAIEGRLRQRRWQGSDGKNQSAVEIVVENFQLLGGRTEAGAPEVAQPAPSFQGSDARFSTAVDENFQLREGRTEAGAPEAAQPAPSFQESDERFSTAVDKTEDDIPF
jgi:single-strand DNA-binding protein